MDKHYLTRLLAPSSIVVFAGDPAESQARTPLARAVLDGLRGEGSAPGKPFAGPISYFDIHMTGKPAELAQARADLAIIAPCPMPITPTARWSSPRSTSSWRAG